MIKSYVLYNPFAKNNQGEQRKDVLKKLFPDKDFIFLDLTHIDAGEFLKKTPLDDEIIICGGDGTLNRFLNATDGIAYENDIYYYPCGTGNDFSRDLISQGKGSQIYHMNEYIKNLPVVTVNNKSYKFLNNVAYGIDGYVCEEAGIVAGKNRKPVNYTSIATKGLAYDYHPRNAEVIIDGKSFSFKKVWLAPTLNGRFFGGGMMIAPDQDRNCGKVTLVVVHNMSRLKVLTSFPKIFKGKHTSIKNIDIFKADNVSVSFDTPCPLQIDGELIPMCNGYTVMSSDYIHEHTNIDKEKESE